MDEHIKELGDQFLLMDNTGISEEFKDFPSEVAAHTAKLNVVTVRKVALDVTMQQLSQQQSLEPRAGAFVIQWVDGSCMYDDVRG